MSMNMSEPKRDTLIFSVALASGDFKTELRLPMPLTKDEQHSAVEKWLDLMQQAFRLGVTSVDANFPGGRQS